MVGFPHDSDNKESVRNAGDLGLIPGLRRSPGESMANHSRRILMDRGAWWTTVHGVAKSQTQLRHRHSTGILVVTSLGAITN